jgi:hypothetical protein
MQLKRLLILRLTMTKWLKSISTSRLGEGMHLQSKLRLLEALVASGLWRVIHAALLSNMSCNAFLGRIWSW